MRRRSFLKSAGLAITCLPWIHRAAAAAPATESETFYKVLSCNIRVALPEDEATGNGWASRRDLCIDVIRAQRPDIVCLQEVLRVQMEDLEKAFADFSAFGFAGPEMLANPEGYHGIAKNPILYSRKRYDFIGGGTYWLSETPHLPGSSSWDSARPRHANWVWLRERKTARQLRVISTHLDHVAQRAREEQIKVILDEAATYPKDFPQILAGDLNARRDNPVIKLVLDAGWTNSQAAAPSSDDGHTTHGFQGAARVYKDTGPKPWPIDFIFTRGPFSPETWKIIRDGRNGRYPSDHYFIGATLAL
jgi:endonuclease/exonuclease/phosphatase family metal-dependent hydrolase